MDNLVISRKSWHYRLYETARDFFGVRKPDPGSICGYFWSWVWYVPWFLIFSVGIFATVVVLIGLIPGLLWSWLHNHSHNAEAILFLFAAIAVLVAVIWGVAFGLDKLGDYVSDVKSKPSSEGLSGVAVAVQYAVAAKSKICPRIQYKD
jgi:hypothetical protein